MECTKRRDRLYKTIYRLKEHIPEPTNGAEHCSIGREAPEDETPKKTKDREKLKRQKERTEEGGAESGIQP
jgi:hypothetical protein